MTPFARSHATSTGTPKSRGGLVYGTVVVGAVATPAAMLGHKAITRFTAMISPEWAQSSSRLDAFVNVFSWFTAYGQAGATDAMTQGACCMLIFSLISV
eukprot:COSAG02_NODE_25551_length_655_cov_1.113309_1_plen_99_part_00